MVVKIFKNIYYNTRTSTAHVWEQIKGKNFHNEVPFVPYVYVDDEDGNIKSIEGNPVSKKTFKNYNEYYIYQKENPNCKENNLKPEIQFLAEQYHNIPDDEIENPKLKVYSIDIEIHKIGAFPKPQDADAPVVLISIYNQLENKTISFGIKDYNGKYKGQDWLTYIHCKNEETLLRQFFDYMHRYSPDVITGWNCIPLSNTIYKENEIVLLSDIQKNNILPNNNKVEIIYPHSYKKINDIKLANGCVLKTSGDHIIPIRYIDNNKYTKLMRNTKNNNHLFDIDLKVCEIPFKEKSCFIQIPFDLNKNKDIEIDNNLLYMAGLIYTDGSMRDKKTPSQGFRVYQSNKELLEQIPYITTKICGNREKGYSRNIKHSVIESICPYIYNAQGEKTLNLTLLSKLSKK